MPSVHWLANRVTISSHTVHDAYLFCTRTLEHPLVQTSLWILQRAVNDSIANPNLIVPLVMSSDLDFHRHNAACSPCCLWAIVEVQLGIPQRRKGMPKVVTTNTLTIEAVLAVWCRLHISGRRLREQAVGRGPAEQSNEDCGEHRKDS